MASPFTVHLIGFDIRTKEHILCVFAISLYTRMVRGRRHNMTSLRVLEVSLDEEKCFCQNHKYIVCCFCTYSAPCGAGATQGVAPSSLALGWGLLPFQGVMMVLGWWRFYRYLHAKFRKESVWFRLV